LHRRKRGKTDCTYAYKLYSLALQIACHSLVVIQICAPQLNLHGQEGEEVYWLGQKGDIQRVNYTKAQLRVIESDRDTGKLPGIDNWFDCMVYKHWQEKEYVQTWLWHSALCHSSLYFTNSEWNFQKDKQLSTLHDEVCRPVRWVTLLQCSWCHLALHLLAMWHTHFYFHLEHELAVDQ
jgi:hypothetical protein